MPLDAPPKFELGQISSNMEVRDVTMRIMNDAISPRQDWHLQGHIRNRAHCPVEEVKCDVSYFSPEGTFLGLDMTNFYDLDKMDPGESAPIDLPLTMPLHTVRCVLNIHSKRKLRNLDGALNDYLDRLETVAKERNGDANHHD